MGLLDDANSGLPKLLATTEDSGLDDRPIKFGPSKGVSKALLEALERRLISIYRNRPVDRLR